MLTGISPYLVFTSVAARLPHHVQAWVGVPLPCSVLAVKIRGVVYCGVFHVNDQATCIGDSPRPKLHGIICSYQSKTRRCSFGSVLTRGGSWTILKGGEL